jgi:hypothetical protein
MNKSTIAGAAMIAAAAITLPIMAWSQNPPQPPAQAMAHDHAEHQHWGRFGKDFTPQQACTDRVAKRAGFVAYMGAKLNLTTDQKPLWDKVVTSTQAAQANETKLCMALPASADDRAKETIVDRMTHRQAMMQAQLQGLQQTQPAVQALYQSLNPDQKAMVDRPFHRD